ncbi:MAG: hypothetical protein ACE5Q6_00245 [Dehalococcoidia bacterium]
MPKREDERNLSLSGKHPVYCTCSACTDRFLKRKGIKSSKGVAREKVKSHPQDCRCATCSLLGSVGDLPELPRRKRSLLDWLLGRG